MKLGLSKSRRKQRVSIFAQENRQLLYAKALRYFAIFSLITVVAAIIFFFLAFAWVSQNLPKPGEVVRREGFSTKIYDRNGVLLQDLFGDERRTPVLMDQIPESLKQATVAVEDKDFYKHQGFDVLTIVRIPYNIIFKQRVIGGSTLTQQLVKNALLSNERSVVRKFKELVLSLQIERTFTKDEILTMYLNEAPYGGTAWGVGTAAEMYFNKPVSELSVLESAILAGLPQRPSAYSPYTGKNDTDGTPLWQVRTKGVLRRMFEDGYLTQLSYEQALTDLEAVTFERSKSDIKAPHFVSYVRQQLEEMYGEDRVESAGFKVTTTLDFELHEKIQQTVSDEIDKVEQLNITNGAVLAMQPQSGEIISMVGSRDFNNTEIGGQFNVVVDGLRQPGSAIKPVTYLAMLQKGYTPASVLADVPTNFTPHENAKNYEPKNYDGKFRGPVNLRSSLGSSLNIPAVKSLAIVGVEEFLTTAFNMGLVTLEPTQDNLKRFGLAVTLGGAEVHMIDLVTAYSSFANGGLKVEPISILKVEDQKGSVLFEQKQVRGGQIIDPAEAFLINNMLSDNSARSIAFGTNSLLNLSPNVAVKTGTTNDQKDNWAIGWSQELIVGAWVGNNDSTPMKQVASGISGATPIWRNTMKTFFDSKRYSAPDWQMPSTIEKVLVDRISGYPARDGIDSREEYVIKGTLPSLPDPVHAQIKLCRGENKLAPDARVSAGDYDEKLFVVLKEEDPFSTDGVNRWQQAIDTWIGAQSDEKFKPPTEYCGSQKEIYVKVTDPQEQRSLEGENITIKAEADSSDGIEKIELYINNTLRETVLDRKYESTLLLPAGKYELKAVAISRSGEKKESAVVHIGTGGVKWDQPDPTPTPSPSPTPTPTPLPILP